MTTTLQENTVIQKTQELCQAILDSSEFQAMRKDIETFLANDKVRGQYDSLVSKGQALQEKQQSGVPLQAAEIEEFEKSREEFVNNPVASGFLNAQEGIEAMKKTVKKYVSKTFELGRVPDENEMASGGGGCGSGCGCH